MPSLILSDERMFACWHVVRSFSLKHRPDFLSKATTIFHKSFQPLDPECTDCLRPDAWFEFVCVSTEYPNWKRRFKQNTYFLFYISFCQSSLRAPKCGMCHKSLDFEKFGVFASYCCKIYCDILREQIICQLVNFSRTRVECRSLQKVYTEHPVSPYPPHPELTRGYFNVTDHSRRKMHCHGSLVTSYCCVLIAGGIGFSLRQVRRQTPYGRYAAQAASRRWVPAKLAWFVQELPSVLVPVLLFLGTRPKLGLVETLLLCLFCGHYFQR